MMRVPVLAEAGRDDPRQADLDRAFAAATGARIYRSGVENGRAMGGPLLVSVAAPELQDVKATLRIREPSPRTRCLCHGDIAVELFDDRGIVGTVGLHHGVLARLEAWPYDAELEDGSRFLAWLAQHGAPEALAAYEAAAASARDLGSVHAAWRGHAPAAVRPHLDALERFPSPPDASMAGPMRDLLAALPSRAELVTAVLEWLGAGGASWASYPSYEGIPLAFLARLPRHEVVDVIATGPRSPEALRGAARFVAMTSGTVADKRTLAAIPPPVRELLSGAAKATGEPDNVARLGAAFSAPSTAAPILGTTIVAQATHGRFVSVCADGAEVVALDGADIVRIHADGVSSVILTLAPPAFTSLAAARGRVVFQRDGGLMTIPAAGGPATLVARPSGKVASVGVVGDWIYWLEDRSRYDGSGVSAFAASRARLTGGEHRLVVPACDGVVLGMIVDARHVYWTRRDGQRLLLERVAVDDGAAQTLASGPSEDMQWWLLASGVPAAGAARVWFGDTRTREIFFLDKDDPAVQGVTSAPGDPVRLAASENGAYVLVRQSGGWHAVGHLGSDGAWNELASFDARSVPRELVAGEGCAYVTVGDTLRRVARTP